MICLALRELELGEDALDRGLEWMAGMQCSNGGWGAFDVDNTSQWLYRVPFFDFGAVIDPPSEDVAGHAVEAFAHYPRYAETTRRGLDYLLREQQDDGSWWGRWGVNHVYGTAAVLPALEAAGSTTIIPPSAARSAGSIPSRPKTAASGRTSAPTTSANGAAGASRRLHKPRGAY